MTDITYLLPIGETIRMSWDKVHGSKSSFWGALGLVFVIMFGLGFADGLIETAIPKIEPVVSILMQIFGFLLNMGIIYIGIRRAQDLPISYSFVFRSFEGWLSLKVIGMYLLQILILIIPIILIIAGVTVYPLMQTNGMLALSIVMCITGVLISIYIAVRIMLSMSFVLDKEIGPWTALKLSLRATRANFWRLIAMLLLQALIIIISAIPFGIGLIWTIPFSYINYGLIYKNLSSNNLN